MPRSEWTVIFVLGGPGVGKGTQCKMLTEEYRLCHLSVGDVLRAETMRPRSQYAEIILENMREGRIGPPRITITLLATAMREKFEKEEISIFLIDGFPRKMDQADLFESEICPPVLVVFLDCPQETLQKRLANRAQTSSRLDDGPDTVKKRFTTFVETSMPVIQHYMTQDRLYQVDASHEISVVYQGMQMVLEKNLKNRLLKIPIAL
ncbi:hypothetical protein EG329_000971 [Mollisiaceae sp. DMI_Dod_QoI]|nr:hypothetical protein EG329_000971 [Helotiales sp. DMI_Dod_QoI]